MKRKILICGGGNGAHVLAALAAANPDNESRVLTLFGDEAERWTKAIESAPMTRIFSEDGKDVEIKSKPQIVSKDPAKVVPGADVIILGVPAFAHQGYLEALEPHINSPTILVGMPAQPGFEFQSYSILKNKLSFLTIMSTETLPWACRIEEYGSRVRIIGAKDSLKVAIIYSGYSGHKEPFGDLRAVIGPDFTLNPAKHFLEQSLMFAVLHPGLMYGRWRDWDGVPLKEKPLFYQGADDFQAKCVTDLNNETMTTTKVIMQKKPSIDLSGCVPTIEWLFGAYPNGISDKSSLKMALKTNKAYQGLVHPMKSVEGGFVPDFKYRYLAEDIPYGLVVMKGLSVLAGVETPFTDTVIAWAQEKLGKQYIIGNELKGANLNETRAPQVYGITSLDQIESFMR